MQTAPEMKTLSNYSAVKEGMKLYYMNNHQNGIRNKVAVGCWSGEKTVLAQTDW